MPNGFLGAVIKDVDDQAAFGEGVYTRSTSKVAVSRVAVSCVAISRVAITRESMMVAAVGIAVVVIVLLDPNTAAYSEGHDEIGFSP